MIFFLIVNSTGKNIYVSTEKIMGNPLRILW